MVQKVQFEVAYKINVFSNKVRKYYHDYHDYDPLLATTYKLFQNKKKTLLIIIS